LAQGSEANTKALGDLLSDLGKRDIDLGITAFTDKEIKKLNVDISKIIDEETAESSIERDSGALGGVFGLQRHKLIAALIGNQMI
jgi:hypothetical protein